MKLLIVEDRRGYLYHEGKEFKVLEMENTIEWETGNYISKSEMSQILGRHGTNTVKVRIKKPKD